MQHKRQIIGLDLIRAFAALLVVLFHLGFWMWRGPGANQGPAHLPMEGLAAEGWVGVEIFFVLSGFVIAYSAQESTPGRFLRHRFLRLFPAALICSSLTALFQIAMAYPAKQVAPLWARSVFLSPWGPWVDGSYWTLPIELAFYAIVCLTLFRVRFFMLEKASAVTGLLSTTTVALLLFTPAWCPEAVLRFLAACWFPPAACTLLLYGVFFAFGVALFSGLHQRSKWQDATQLFVFFAGCLGEITFHERGAAHAVGRPSRAALACALWTVAVLLVVVSVQKDQSIRSVLGPRAGVWCRRIGLATYPLYLLHASIGMSLMGGLTHRIGVRLSLTVVILVMGSFAGAVSMTAEPWLRKRCGVALERIGALWSSPKSSPLRTER